MFSLQLLKQFAARPPRLRVEPCMLLLRNLCQSIGSPTTASPGTPSVNGVTTQIGNDAFAWFSISFSKSRLNFLERLGITALKVDPDPLRYRRGHEALWWTRTGFAMLDRPEVPLDTNGSANHSRADATRREVSGGTRSEVGNRTRDSILGLMKTCKKLGLSYWDDLGGRLEVPDPPRVPPLPGLVKQGCIAMA